MSDKPSYLGLLNAIANDLLSEYRRLSPREVLEVLRRRSS